jgi:hypothetical protein
VLALFLIVVGGLYSGLFTATQAGSIGAFGSLVFAMARRKPRNAHSLSPQVKPDFVESRYFNSPGHASGWKDSSHYGRPHFKRRIMPVQ